MGCMTPLLLLTKSDTCRQDTKPACMLASQIQPVESSNGSSKETTIDDLKTGSQELLQI